MHTNLLTRASGKILAGCLAFVALLALPAAPSPAKAEPRGLLGQAQYKRGDGAFQPVRKGTQFEPGDVIMTANKSALDIDFGGAIGTVRLTESTTLVIEKATAGDGDFQLKLYLRDGEMLGRVTRHSAGSRFEVKLDSALGVITEGQFRVSAKGYMVQVDGKSVFVHVPAGGEPAVHTLNTPPSVYFSPAQGVRAAPAELVKEVENQMRSKLPKP